MLKNPKFMSPIFSSYPVSEGIEISKEMKLQRHDDRNTLADSCYTSLTIHEYCNNIHGSSDAE